MKISNRTFLAEGGMATIHEGLIPANDGPNQSRDISGTNPQIPVIEKAIRADKLHIPAVREGFRHEGNVCTKLGDRFPWSFPKAYPQYSTDETLCMEKFQHGSLLDHLNNVGALSYKETLDIGVQLCESLTLLSGTNGIVHRDLKHGNIMVSERSPRLKVKLIDFGISCDKKDPMKNGRAPIGTPSYWPPEALNHKKTHDCRFDLYSLGIILTEAFNRKILFQDDQHEKTPLGAILKPLKGFKRAAMMVIGKDPNHSLDPAALPDVKKLPSGLRRIVIKLLQSNEHDRYQTPGEVGRDLAELAIKQDRTLEKVYPFDLFRGNTVQKKPGNITQLYTTNEVVI